MMLTGARLIGCLLVGPWLAHRWLGIRRGRLTGERAFIAWVLWLGIGALASALVDPRLRPGAVGLHLTRSWLITALASAAIGGVGCFLLVRGLWGAPAPSVARWSGWPVLQGVLVAVVMGAVEEYYFRGVWGTLGGALLANALYVLLLSPPWPSIQAAPRIQAWSWLNMLTLFGFGLSLSWTYTATRSLAMPVGLHTAAYFVYHRWPRTRAGRSPATWGYWLGQEDPALGLGPLALYWVAAALCVRWLSTSP